MSLSFFPSPMGVFSSSADADQATDEAEEPVVAPAAYDPFDSYRATAHRMGGQARVRAAYGHHYYNHPAPDEPSEKRIHQTLTAHAIPVDAEMTGCFRAGWLGRPVEDLLTNV